MNVLPCFMISKSLKFAIFFILFFIILHFSTAIAQTWDILDYSTTNGTANISQVQIGGTGITGLDSFTSGILKTVQVYTFIRYAYTENPYISVFDNTAGIPLCNSATVPNALANGVTTFDFSSSGCASLNPAHTYQFSIQAHFSGGSGSSLGLGNNGTVGGYIDASIKISSQPPDIFDGSTHFVSFLPAASSTVATTTTVQYIGFINSLDFATSSTQIIGHYTNNGCLGESSSVLDAFNGGSCFFDISYNATSSGAFDLSTTSVFTFPGQWNYVLDISNTKKNLCFFGYCPFATTKKVSQVSGFFTQGGLNYADIINQYIASSSKSFLLTATSTDSCNIISGNWSLSSCLSLLFFPDQQQFSDLFSTMNSGFLQKVPLGYVTRIDNLISGNVASTSSLPSYVVTVPSFLMNDGQIYSADFTPWNLMLSTSSQLSTATSSTGATLRSITEPYWNTLWYILFALTLVLYVTGLNKYI